MPENGRAFSRMTMKKTRFRKTRETRSYPDAVGESVFPSGIKNPQIALGCKARDLRVSGRRSVLYFVIPCTALQEAFQFLRGEREHGHIEGWLRQQRRGEEKDGIALLIGVKMQHGRKLRFKFLAADLLAADALRL